ncbi:MAG TPA: acyl-CoA dehydrogenase family protein [Solirubrobacterales bacterium]|nr:acyl-CoA dehydrogenase family protein [Solirubrobacterales bacterium]
MRFALTEDQAALRHAVRDLLARECRPAVVREAWEGGADAPGVAAVWAKLAEMGVLGAAVPEEAGGLGLGACDVVPLLEEAGRVALPLPIVETAFVAAPLLAAVGDADAVGGIVEGDLLVACALDGADEVPWAGDAGLVLVAERPGGPVTALRASSDAGAGSTVVAAAGSTLSQFPDALSAAESIDAARRVGILTDRAAATDLGATDEDCLAAWQRGALGAAAQLIGLSRALLAMSVAYAEERRQFGVPIGTFQAVKHHLANALLGVEFAAPAVLRAAWSMDTDAATADRDVAMAKALASDAAERVAATALQAHGAIAYTTEYDLHLFAKRVWAGSRSWGTAEWQRARVATALGLDKEGSSR